MIAPLTRIQVESLLDEMSVISYSPSQLQLLCRQLLDHDAAFRSKIESIESDIYDLGDQL